MARLRIYLERTVIVQGAVLLVFVVAVLTHVLIGHTLPGGVWIALGCALGLWWGLLSRFNLKGQSHTANKKGG